MPCQDFYCSYAEGYGGVGQCRGKAMKLRKSSLNAKYKHQELNTGRVLWAGNEQRKGRGEAKSN